MADQARASAVCVEDRLFADNLGLVLSFSGRYGIFDADYLQARTIDLWRAMKAFDSSQGCQFSTLAYTYMTRGSQRDWKHERCQCRGGGVQHSSLEQLMEGIGLGSLEGDDEAPEFDVPEPFDERSDLDEIDHARHIVSELMRCMSPRGREMVLSKYFDGQTLQQIGDRHGITRERVRQIIERELKRCRTLLQSSPRLSP
jgi:RNA polymerase sigma factor (sigma-70 family)